AFPLVDQGRFAEAIPWLEKLNALRAQKQGKDHWQTSNAARELQLCRRMADQPADVQRALAQTLTAGPRLQALHRAGKYREAERLAQDPLRVRREVLGADDVLVGIAHGYLSAAERALHQFDRAIENHRRVLAIFRQALPPAHPLL